MRNERLSCSASASLATMPRKRSVRSEISSEPRASGIVDVVAARGDVLGRQRQRAHGLGETPGEPQEEHAAERDADGEREREPAEQHQPLLAELGLGLRDDEPAERLRAVHELNRLRRGDQTSTILAGRRELDDDLLVAIEPRASEVAAVEPRQAEPLAGEERLADVVQLVTGRELELLRRELRRLHALVATSGAPTPRTARRAPSPRDVAPGPTASASRPGRAAPRARSRRARRRGRPPGRAP